MGTQATTLNVTELQPVPDGSEAAAYTLALATERGGDARDGLDRQ